MTAPTRPSIPFLLWLVAAVWAGLVAAEWACWSSVPGIRLAALGLLALSGCVAAVCLSRGQSIGTDGRSAAGVLAIAALLTVAFCSGALYGTAYWSEIASLGDRFSSAGTVTLRGEVSEDPVVRERGATVLLRVAEGPLRGHSAGVMWPAGHGIPRAGQLVTVRGTAVRDEAPKDEWARRRFRAGQVGTVRAWKAEVREWARSPVGTCGAVRRRVSTALRSMDNDGARLLEGVLLGDRTTLRGTGLEMDFRTCGLSHLVAVSGTHLAIVAYLLGGLLSVTGLSRASRLSIVLCGCVVYVALAGAHTSALRALFMGLVAASATFSGRRGDPLGALALATCVLLAFSPSQAFDLGLALSVSAVAGLIVFAPLANAWVTAAVSRRSRTVASALSVTVVAQMATLPLTVPAFNLLSLVGPVANVVTAPLVTVGLGTGLAGAVVMQGWAPAGAVVLRLATLPLALAARIASRLAVIPYAAIPVGGSALVVAAAALGCAALLWALWPQPTGRRGARWLLAASVVLVAVVGMGPPDPLAATVVVLDVGQGDAILVRDGAAAVLVDTGPDPALLRSAMARYGLRDLDAVVITHDHADHSAGLAGLRGVVKVKRVLVPDTADPDDFEGVAAFASETGSAFATLSQGAHFRVGRIGCEVLWPPAGWRGDDKNDSSVVIRAAAGRNAILLTGDAESAVYDTLLREDLLPATSVLKVAHHGSDDGISDAALDHLSARVAIVSVGTPNDYGHPSPGTLAQLLDAGIRVIRTDHSGDVTVDLVHGRVGVRETADVCDNACRSEPLSTPEPSERTGCLRALAISNPSTSSTARKTCSSNALSPAFASASKKPADRISTSMSLMPRARSPTRWSPRPICSRLCPPGGS